MLGNLSDLGKLGHSAYKILFGEMFHKFSKGPYVLKNAASGWSNLTLEKWDPEKKGQLRDSFLFSNWKPFLC